MSISTVGSTVAGLGRGSVNAAASMKQMEAQKLRSELHSVHNQLMALPGLNPNKWHELLDKYVVLTARLYMALS
jgi:hypothetical protein